MSLPKRFEAWNVNFDISRGYCSETIVKSKRDVYTGKMVQKATVGLIRGFEAEWSYRGKRGRRVKR
ncbi:MAG: hypothetical protein ACTSRF_04730 [Candidatus Freyarchaeota archaeon]